MYITTPRQFKLWTGEVVVVFDIIVAVSRCAIHCALLHSVYDLNFAQMNVQLSPVQEFMLKQKQPKTFVA